jgi:CubicO group peptidase (beta-lactamase class C family)
MPHASVSASAAAITWALAMMLVERGQLKLDDQFRIYPLELAL